MRCTLTGVGSQMRDIYLRDYFFLEAFLESPGWAQSYRLHLANVSGHGGGEGRDIPSKERSRSKSSEMRNNKVSLGNYTQNKALDKECQETRW